MKKTILCVKKMEYKRLGNTGLKISSLALGTMQFGWRCDEELSFALMDKALECGINIFDTADIYYKWGEGSYAGRSEEIIGKWMKDRGTRDEIVLATKLWGEMSDDINDRGLSRRHIQQSIKGSLKRLQTDWIDIYFAHTFDHETPLEETLKALSTLVDQGKVNYLGASNHPVWRIMHALWLSDKYNLARYDVLQPVYNIARRHTYEQEFESIIQEFKLGVISYSPLGGGFLTGQYKKDKKSKSPRYESVKRRYFKDRNFEIVKALERLSKEKDVSKIQLAIAWVLNVESITAPIIGANTMEQFEENVGALELKLSEDDLKFLDEASEWESLDKLSR